MLATADSPYFWRFRQNRDLKFFLEKAKAKVQKRTYWKKVHLLNENK